MLHVFARRWLWIVLGLACAPAHADLVLSSAPRDTKEKEEATFKPITELLTRVTGEKVRFVYGDNFLVYQSEMRKGAYDIVVDGPSFVGWRMAKQGHVPLVKFPGNLVFAVITKSNQSRINALPDLIGRTVCAFPPPNLATLTILDQFDNPARQPLILEAQNFGDAYKGVVSGRCIGAIIQAKLVQELDKDKNAVKVVFTSQALPNQAFSAGPKVTPEMRDKIVKALLSPEGVAATQSLRDIYKAPALLPATVEEFQGLGRLMRNEWGFEN
jgi:ABC-type phosphate/phosphonate transport system substrate-binding protein